MLVKTDELTGDALCFVVAKLNGYHYFPNGAALYIHHDNGEWYRSGGYRPDINWHQGGPIFEQMRPTIAHENNLVVCSLSHPIEVNYTSGVAKRYCTMRGETILIAAMRCFVASKLGDTVEVPDELTT